MQDCSLYLFGSPRLQYETQQIALGNGPLAALLVFLALNRQQPISRLRLAATIWPDLPEPQARRALSATLYRLRQNSPSCDEWLLANAQTLQLGSIWCDLQAFQQGAQSNQSIDWQLACQLYRDELLPDVDAEWLDGPRADLQALFAATIAKLAHHAFAQGDYSVALTSAERWQAFDPFDEQACMLLMRCHVSLGRPHLALTAYRHLCERLAADLGVEPVAETSALAEQIRAEQTLRQTTIGGSWQKIPFVGRTHERSLLLDGLDAALSHSGGLVLLDGAAGIGKTRLLHELSQAAQARGFRVAWGAGQINGGNSPYAPLDQALTQILDQSLLDQFDPITRLGLSALVPNLPQLSQHDHANRPSLPAALLNALLAATQQAPLLLVLDDMHWAQRIVFNVLQWSPSQIQALLRSRLLLILAYRGSESSHMLQALRRMRQELPVQSVKLNGLALHDFQHLVGRLWPNHVPIPSMAEIAALHALTAGNPLFLQEQLLHRGDAHEHSFQALVAQRVQALPMLAHRALAAANALGRSWTLAAWRFVAGTEVDQAIPDLLDARLVAQTHAGFQFYHDLIAVAVEQSLALELCQAAVQQAANYFEQQPLCRPETIAWAYERAQRWAAAIGAYQQAGEQALQAYAYTTALDYANRALELYQQIPVDARLELTLLRLRQRVLVFLGQLEVWRADVERLETLALSLGDQAALLEVYESRIVLSSVDSNPTEMASIAERALDLAQAQQLPAVEARILNTYGFHLISSAAVQPRNSLPLLERAVALARSSHDDTVLVAALCSLAFAYRMLGDTSIAQRIAAEALTLTELHPYLYPARGNVLRVLSEVGISYADWETALSTMNKSIELLEALDDIWLLGVGLFMSTFITTALGLTEMAQATTQRIRQMIRDSKMPPNSNWSFFAHSVTILVALEAGDFEQAETVVQEVQPWLDQAHQQGAGLYLLSAIGAMEIFRNRPDQALPLLRRATAMWQQARSAFLQPILMHALAAQLCGFAAEAQAMLAEAEAMYDPKELFYADVLLHFTRFWVYGDRLHLQHAYSSIHNQANRFRDPTLRDSFINNVKLHGMVLQLQRVAPLAGAIRSMAGLWMRLTRVYGRTQMLSEGGYIQRKVLLVRADVPLGKSLSHTDRVEVIWTLHAPEDNRFNDRSELRIHRLQRLLDEADDAGAAPTDDDLADALAVSRRTIIRDMALLQSQGSAVSTRRRRAVGEE
ncbi:MAG TPA: DUF1670 domain-containing protein [Herpetosiphon sp.]|uniref:Transcriptional regulator, SARP family n=1 Tax=Herpetosiphon aurantiacus (strain ATCC 23779 / DSM 785 / 114-95) TaxID=316274 RepID=A9B6A6_HERA2|nr:AAA family ATPase [Herpetosiphon sp.]ABX06317.1 transcriptional regulator, SARP family [Herpetosiphon aurantiacus DSM 785]HBW49753.1 DUF1670 domain-containing protein [Herpetosiphon sp.]